MSSLNRVILICGKIFYAFVLGFYLLSAFTFVVELFSASPPDRVGYQLFDAVVISVRSYILYFIFSQGALAYGHWVARRKEIFVNPLRKIVKALYVVSVLDLVILIGKYSVNFKYPEVTAAIPAIQLARENEKFLIEVVQYLTPRPVGVFAFLMALFIANLIKGVQISSPKCHTANE